MTPWWTQEAAVWFGVIGGGGGGALCGLLGALVGVLAPRGVGRRFFVPLFGIIVAAGVVMLGAGVVALVQGQPYHVFYPLMLCGGIMALVMGGLMPVLVMRYRQADARRLHAEDLRRG